LLFFSSFFFFFSLCGRRLHPFLHALFFEMLHQGLFACVLWCLTEGVFLPAIEQVSLVYRRECGRQKWCVVPATMHDLQRACMKLRSRDFIFFSLGTHGARRTEQKLKMPGDLIDIIDRINKQGRLSPGSGAEYVRKSAGSWTIVTGRCDGKLVTHDLLPE
jgi:hypothetical protein